MIKLKYISFLCIVVLPLLLTSCNKQLDEAYFLTHPEKIKKTVLSCEKMEFNQVRQDKCCIAAVKANRVIISLSDEMFDNPQKFGSKILKNQEVLEKLNARIVKLKKKTQPKEHKTLINLEKQYYDLNAKIKIMIRLVAEAEGMR